MTRQQFTHEEAITVWRARDVHRVHSVLRGLLILFFAGELLMYCTVGSWYFGVLAITLQLGALWCLRWALRWGLLWARRGLWWCIDHARGTR
jgi:hypothetical protein